MDKDNKALHCKDKRRMLNGTVLCEIGYNMKQCTVCSILRTRIPSYRSTFAGFAVCPSIRSPFCRFALLSYLVLPCPPERLARVLFFLMCGCVRTYMRARRHVCVCSVCGVVSAGQVHVFTFM
jgi:hypothetical protein